MSSIRDDIAEVLCQLTLHESDDHAVTDTHIDAEQLSLFVEHALSKQERQEVVEHLDVCWQCRATVGFMLVGEEIQVEPAQPNGDHRQAVLMENWRVWFSVAAALLLTVSICVYYSGRNGEGELVAQVSRQLAASDFAAVDSMLQRADDEGIRSPGLTNLKVQSMLQIPSRVSLESRGSLLDFGYSLQGVQARDVAASTSKRIQEAYAILAQVPSDTDEIRLNEGYLLLRLGRGHESRHLFQAAHDADPKAFLPLMGLGLAEYLEQNFKSAEQAFRQALTIRPTHDSVKLNLGMCLIELGDYTQAAQVLRQVSPASLPVSEQPTLSSLIEELEFSGN